MKTLVTLVVILLAASSHAEARFQFAAPGLRAPDDPFVNGIRVTALFGRNQSVRGVDLGMFSVSETGDMTGFRSILGIGRLRGDLRGCATAAVNLHDGIDRGANVAFANLVNEMRSGANVGVVNLVDRYSSTDVGAVNIADRSGVQLGVLNITRRLEGVQLGLLNLADNGFLPVFPLFNFPTR